MRDANPEIQSKSPLVGKRGIHNTGRNAIANAPETHGTPKRARP